jgi:hypothetical protein
MPVRGPQYESQHRAMEQEYGYGVPSNQGPQAPPPIRTGSAPPAPMGGGSSGYHHYNNHRMSPQQMMQQGMSGSQPGQSIRQQTMQPGQYYFDPAEAHGPNQTVQGGASYSLPPGAMMPPLSIDQAWLSQSQSGQPASPNSSSPGQQSQYAYIPPHSAPASPQHQTPPRRPRSPPPNHLANQGHPKHPTATPPGARLQGRSLSATAAPPQQPQQPMPNGRLKKKHASAVAAPVRRRSSDGAGGFGDEDLPLAVWQQQQQQRAGGRR